jgi:hypothetical protein
MTSSDFTTLYRTAVRDLYDARQRLKQLKEQDAATGIVASLPDGPLPGSNGDISKADLVAAMAAAGELEGHLTDYTAQPNVPTPTNIALQRLQ